jgi:NitT/TauT family transport system substrate-binding protein
VAGLGEKRRLFFLYSLTFNMVALESSNLSDSDVVSVLKALIKAEKFIADQPDEAMKLVAQFLDKELQQVKRLWPNYDYRMHLKDSLRLTIDSQIKWRDKLEKVDSEILGNLETFFRVKPLSLVDDGRVSLTF